MILDLILTWCIVIIAACCVFYRQWVKNLQHALEAKEQSTSVETPYYWIIDEEYQALREQVSALIDERDALRAQVEIKDEVAVVVPVEQKGGDPLSVDRC